LASPFGLLKFARVSEFSSCCIGQPCSALPHGFAAMASAVLASIAQEQSKNPWQLKQLRSQKAAEGSF